MGEARRQRAGPCWMLSRAESVGRSIPAVSSGWEPQVPLVGEGKGSWDPCRHQLLAGFGVGVLLVGGKSCYPKPLSGHLSFCHLSKILQRCSRSPGKTHSLTGGLGCPHPCVPSHPTEHPRPKQQGSSACREHLPSNLTQAVPGVQRLAAPWPLHVCRSFPPGRPLGHWPHTEGPARPSGSKPTTPSCSPELAAPHLSLCLGFLLGTIGMGWLLPWVWGSIWDSLSAQRGADVIVTVLVSAPSWARGCRAWIAESPLIYGPKRI